MGLPRKGQAFFIVMSDFPPAKHTSAEKFKENFLNDLERLNAYVHRIEVYDRFQSALEEAGVDLSIKDLTKEEQEAGNTLLSRAMVEPLTPYQIHRLCFFFWRNLPDDRSIHAPFFSDLCDYCSEWNTWETVVTDIPDEKFLNDPEIVTLK
jgi:hypothetical protein